MTSSVDGLVWPAHLPYLESQSVTAGGLEKQICFEAVTMRRASRGEVEVAEGFMIWDPGRGDSASFGDMDVSPQKRASLSLSRSYSEQQAAVAVAVRATRQGEQYLCCSTCTGVSVACLVMDTRVPRTPPSGLYGQMSRTAEEVSKPRSVSDRDIHRFEEFHTFTHPGYSGSWGHEWNF